MILWEFWKNAEEVIPASDMLNLRMEKLEKMLFNATFSTIVKEKAKEEEGRNLIWNFIA